MYNNGVQVWIGLGLKQCWDGNKPMCIPSPPVVQCSVQVSFHRDTENVQRILNHARACSRLETPLILTFLLFV
jgi:hypothetical protein